MKPQVGTFGSADLSTSSPAQVGTFGSADLSTSSPALVGIIMGSDSDLSVMKDAAEILKEFGIESEVKVLSAHRTPDQAVEYAKNAEANGLKVIIAGAGGAAHLAGVTAGNTVLPVVGVPISTKALKGIDSLLSTAQMPPGIPVATVAINGAKNAGILAAQIIAEGNPKVREKLRAYKKKMEKDVLTKTERLGEVGYEAYLNDKTT